MKAIYPYLCIIIILSIAGCKQRFSPKPEGYLRIDLAQKNDSLFKPYEYPFYFITSDYFILNKKHDFWIDLTYSKHNATIYITYKKIQNNLFQLLEESRNMVYKHTIKADAISEKIYSNNNNNTYGTLYDIKGEAASSVQFHLTDSVKNFIRGSLYFHTNTNPDSLSPIINYLRYDIIKIMETLQWVAPIALTK